MAAPATAVSSVLPNGYALAVVGYRRFVDYSRAADALDAFIHEYGRPGSIVSGGCEGADQLAERYANNHGITMVTMSADWRDASGGGRLTPGRNYRQEAGPERNARIVEAADALVAFVSTNSRGTRNTLRLARQKRMRVIKSIDID